MAILKGCHLWDLPVLVNVKYKLIFPAVTLVGPSLLCSSQCRIHAVRRCSWLQQKDLQYFPVQVVVKYFQGNQSLTTKNKSFSFFRTTLGVQLLLCLEFVEFNSDPISDFCIFLWYFWILCTLEQVQIVSIKVLRHFEKVLIYFTASWWSLSDRCEKLIGFEVLSFSWCQDNNFCNVHSFHDCAVVRTNWKFVFCSVG